METTTLLVRLRQQENGFCARCGRWLPGRKAGCPALPRARPQPQTAWTDEYSSARNGEDTIPTSLTSTLAGNTKQVAAGDHYGVALTMDGYIYMW